MSLEAVVDQLSKRVAALEQYIRTHVCDKLPDNIEHNDLPNQDLSRKD